MMGSVRVPTWTAIGDCQPTGGDAAPGCLGARHRAVKPTREPVKVKELHGMRSVRSLVVAVLAVPTVVLADGRVALVVGNSTYAHIWRLPNPEK